MTNELVSIANHFRGLPFDELIGGPLNAAARANSSMAVTQTQFMLNTCFTKDNENYQPIMINMTLTQATINPDGSVSSEEFNFKVPLLTIIPLNSLAVQTVTIDFEMEVKSSFSEENQDSNDTSFNLGIDFEATGGWGPLSASIRGNVSYTNNSSNSHSTHYQKSNSARYHVNVTAGQLELPKGVNTIIDAYASLISPQDQN